MINNPINWGMIWFHRNIYCCPTGGNNWLMIAIQSMDLVLLGLFFDRVSGFFGILELAMPPLRILKDSCDLSVANQDSLRSLETLLRPCGTSMLENIFIAGISDHGGCSGDALGMLWGCFQKLCGVWESIVESTYSCLCIDVCATDDFGSLQRPILAGSFPQSHYSGHFCKYANPLMQLVVRYLFNRMPALIGSWWNYSKLGSGIPGTEERGIGGAE